jgi:hypothetical protein
VGEHRRFVAVAGDVHRVTLLSESSFDESCDFLVVLDDKEFRSTPDLLSVEAGLEALSSGLPQNWPIKLLKPAEDLTTPVTAPFTFTPETCPPLGAALS